MMIDKANPPLPTGSDLQIWRRDDGEMPAWVRGAMVGQPQSNGSFLIGTPLGQQRVHRGYLVVEQAGQIYSCPPNEADQRVAELRQGASAASSVSNLIGPGKSLSVNLPKRPKRSRAAPARRRVYPQPKGAMPSIEWVHVSELKVDEDYQRSIDNSVSKRLIASIAAHWDWRLCMPLAVSRRDDVRFVIDGQHRLAAARLRADLPQLPCCVATYNGPADEAAMFVAANRSRKAISRLDDFHAALVAGDEDAIEVQRVVNEAGLRISRWTASQSWRPGEVAFTSSVHRILGKHGEEHVSSVLRALAKHFDGQVLTNGASIFLALSKLLVSHEGVEKDRLFGCLSAHDMNGWSKVVLGIKGGDTRAQAMREALLDLYADRSLPQQQAA